MGSAVGAGIAAPLGVLAPIVTQLGPSPRLAVSLAVLEDVLEEPLGGFPAALASAFPGGLGYGRVLLLAGVVLDAELGVTFV